MAKDSGRLYSRYISARNRAIILNKLAVPRLGLLLEGAGNYLSKRRQPAALGLILGTAIFALFMTMMDGSSGNSSSPGTIPPRCLRLLVLPRSDKPHSLHSSEWGEFFANFARSLARLHPLARPLPKHVPSDSS